MIFTNDDLKRIRRACWRELDRLEGLHNPPQEAIAAYERIVEAIETEIVDDAVAAKAVEVMHDLYRERGKRNEQKAKAADI